MKQRAFRQIKTGYALSKKSPSPATGTSGHEYALYYVVRFLLHKKQYEEVLAE